MKSKQKTLLTIIFLTVGVVIFIAFQSFADKDRDIPSTATTVTPSQGSSGYSEISHYSGAVEVDRFDVEGDGVQARYELSPNVTLIELMDFYQNQLESRGWQTVSREMYNSELNMLTEDGIRFRVWVYFIGSIEEDIPISYNIDYYPPSAGEMLPIPVQ